jgi:hypothetical protein
MIPEVEKVFAKLEVCRSKPDAYEGGHGYWDDLCLAYFLKGVFMRYIAYPVMVVLDNKRLRI